MNIMIISISEFVQHTYKRIDSYFCTLKLREVLGWESSLEPILMHVGI